MTTITLLKTNKTLFIGSDSQVSLGNLRLADPFDKIKLFGEVLVGSCGSVALTQKLSNLAYKNLKINAVETESTEEPNVEDFAKELSELNFYMPLQFKDFHSAGFLLAGFGRDKNLKGYSVGDDGSLIEVKSFASDGSGSQLALSILQEGYSPDLEEKQGLDLCYRAILSASKQDLYTNNQIKVYSISAETGEIKLWKFDTTIPEGKVEVKE